MKYHFSFLFLFCALFSLNGLQAQSTATQELWLTQIKEAQTLAQADDKPIVLVFSGSDWCRPCMNMKRNVFDKEIFTSYASENVVLLEIDFPRRRQNLLSAEQQRHNQALAQKYNIRYFPTMVVVDANGKELDRIGYQSSMGAGEYVKFIKHRTSK